MKMKMKSVGVFLLILVSLGGMCCNGCWEQEREALLRLPSRPCDFDTEECFRLSWADGTDCCEWEGVECNPTTGRVAKLNLFSRRDQRLGPWYLNYSDFIVFKDLKSLDLSSNNVAGCAQIEGMENLEVLHLSYNGLDNSASLLSCLDGLSSIKSLNLTQNGFNATSIPVFETLSSKLPRLRVLDISGNHLNNDILPSLGGFTSLNELYLSSIGLNSDLHFQGLCAMLVNLEVLDLSFNDFNDSDIASALSGLSSLKTLNLGYILMTPNPISILNISKLRSLEILDLAGNELNESVLWSSDNDGFAWPTSLQVLGLSHNSFSDNILSSLSRLRRLKSLDLSWNELEGSLDISGSKNLSRLNVLALDGNKINGSKLRKSLQAFSSIRMLSLKENEFKGKIVAGDFRDLGNLEHLAMDESSNLENEFFKSIGELTSLKVLSLDGCGINGTLPDGDWSKLKKLEELDLSSNHFVGPLPSSFVNMTSLHMLELSYNHFTGNFDSNIASLTSLEYFGFIGNQFEVPVSFTTFANHSKLKFIYGEGNRVILDSPHSLQTWIPKFQLQVLSLSSTTESNSLPFPNFLFYQYNLTSLDLTSWKLEGEFPNWLLENNTKMTELIVRNCSITGIFQLPSRPLLSIRTIDVSDNIITGQIPGKNISSIFPNLQFLNMSVNDIQGSIPHEFGQMNLLVSLDLSHNHLFGEIPKNISRDRSLLRLLKLSNNKLEGPMFPTLKYLDQLYLDDNSLSGCIPSAIFNSSMAALDISNNHFVGKLPSWIGNFSNLITLFMSNNHLEGSIPTSFMGLESLVYLDISQNDFMGFVPSFVNTSLRFIYLNNNRLCGLSKRMFTERSSITILDLRYNEITSNIHNMIQDLSSTWLSILLLKGNHLSGQIPKKICQLTDLTILDLSYNKFSGPIPSCLGKIPFKIPVSAQFQVFDGIYDRYKYPFVDGKNKANFNTKKRSYTYTGDILYYMTGIDLSSNKLSGHIPSELGNMTNVRALNLSHNYLTGQIPATFSRLALIESLDLSHNKLSSKIPPQLNELTSLAVFSVAHNNLSGTTPERKGQFITFDESSYVGNPFLCGPPLPKSCNPYGTTPAITPNDSCMDGDNGGWVDIYVFYVSFSVSYTIMLFVVAAVLYINPYWRRAWFYYAELVSMNSYYFIEDSLLKFSKYWT